jgi:hypothetical protein
VRSHPQSTPGTRAKARLSSRDSIAHPAAQTRPRIGRNRSRDRPGRGHPAVLHPRIRQLSNRAGRHHAALAAALRPPSACQRHDQRRAITPCGHTDTPLGVAIACLVRRHPARLLRDLRTPLPQPHLLSTGADLVCRPTRSSRHRGRRFRTHHGATVLTSLTSALEMDEQPDRGFSVVGLGVGPDVPALPARLA